MGSLPTMNIQSYRFGYVQIDGKDYRNDVKLIGKRVVPEWWRSQGHLVQVKDVRDLLNADPEICIFGTGAYGSMRVSEEVRYEFQNRGVEVLIEKTESACDTYMRLLQDGKKVVAGFHLSC
jgi:hypothetical protein